jgi:predicted dehydrogenase
MFHAPMLSAAAGVELAGIWARRPEAAAALAAAHGTAAVASFEELLDGCDAVAFAVPPDVQARYAPAAARAGKHLLLEKPLAFTLDDARAIADAVDEAGVATLLMLTYRFTAPVRDLLAAVGGGAVRHARAGWFTGAALAGSPFATPWRTEPGAALLDIGPHALDLLETAAGPIESVRAAASGGVTLVTTTHGGGAVGQVALSITTPGTGGALEFEVVTDTGRIVLADPSPGADVPAAIAAEFVRTVRGEIGQPLDVHRGLRLQHLIAAVTESVGTGRAVTPGG